PLQLSQFLLLLCACALLLIAACVDRPGSRPVCWMALGVVLLAAGMGLGFVAVDLGAERERLTEIVMVLFGVAQTGVLGVGFLVLCVAAVAHRPARDSRQEPADAARYAAIRLCQAYVRHRGADRKSTRLNS